MIHERQASDGHAIGGRNRSTYSEGGARERAVGGSTWPSRTRSAGGVYATVGLLAAQAALGVGGTTTDSEGVLAWIMEASFGRLLLDVMAAGLIGYAIWRFVQTIRDTEAKGTKPGGLLARTGFAGSGIVYLSLAVSALQFSIGARQAAEHDAAQVWTARLLNAPLGQSLVLVVGLVVLGVAVGQAYCAYQRKFAGILRATRCPKHCSPSS